MRQHRNIGDFVQISILMSIYTNGIQDFDLIYLYVYFIYLQGSISNIIDENVLQPLLVSTSAITLAAECVRSILKIDDIVSIKGTF